MNNIDKLTYSQFKELMDRNLLYHHIEGEGSSWYLLRTIDGGLEYICKINTSADIADYESNYKANANQVITNKVCLNPCSVIQKLDYSYNEQNLTCNTSSWTLFFQKDFGENVTLLDIIITTGNNHLIKMLIDDVEIFNFNIQDMEELLDCNSEASRYFSLIRDKQTRRIGWKLHSFIQGQNIKIYQMRRSGSGKLKMHGYAIVYEVE